MSTITNNVRWSTNSDELARDLRSSLTQIQSTSASAAQSVGQFDTSLKKSGGEVKNLASVHGQLASAIQNPLGAVKQLGVSFGTELVGAGGQAAIALGAIGTIALAVGGSLVALAGQSREVAASINDLSEVTGMSVPGASALKFAMEAVGGSFEQTSGLMFQFEQRMDNSSKKVDEGLKQIGLSLEDIRGLSADQRLYAISDGFRAAGADVNKAAVAMNIFGKQGRDSLPLLLKPLRELADTAHDVGAVLGGDAAQAAEDFDTKLHTLKATTNAAYLQLGLHVSIADQFTYGYNRMKLAVANVGLTAVDLVTGFGYLGAAWDTLRDAMGRPLPQEPLKDLAADAKEAADRVFDLARTPDKIVEAIKKAALGRAFQPLVLSADEARDAERRLDDQIKNANESRKKATAEQVKREKENAQALDDTIKRFDNYQKDGVAAASAVAKGFGGGLTVLRDMGMAIGSIRSEWKTLADNVPLVDFSKVLKALPTTLDAGVFPQFFAGLKPGQAGVQAGHDFTNAFTGVLGGLPDLMVKGLTGGGGIEGAFKALGVQLADAIVTPIMAGLSKAQKAAIGLGAAAGLGTAAAGGSGGQAAGAVGMATVGVATTAALTTGATVAGVAALSAATLGVGLAAVGAYYGLKKLFGGDKEWKKVNDARDSFIDAAGGLHALNVRAQEAGLTLDRLLDAKNPAQYQAAVTELTDALGRTDRISQDITSRGFLSKSELTELAQRAHDVFDAIVEGVATGQYTQEQATAAQLEYQKALAATGDLAAVAWLKTAEQIEKGTALSNAALDDLKKRRESLAQSIANEAPEQVMGVVEAQVRGQIAALDKEIDDAQQALERQARATAEEIERALGSINPATITVPYRYELHGPGLPGGGEAPEITPGDHESIPGLWRGGIVPAYAAFGMVTPFRSRGTDTVPAMLTPGEWVIPERRVHALADFVFKGQEPKRQSAAAQAFEVTVNHQTILDGEVIARHQERYTQKALRDGRLTVPERNIVRRSS